MVRMFITHSFEGFLEGLVRGRGWCIAGVWLLGWFTRRGLLVLRLGRWWDLLLVLFLAHLLEAVVEGFWHFQGGWKRRGGGGQTHPSSFLQISNTASFWTTLFFYSFSSILPLRPENQVNPWDRGIPRPFSAFLIPPSMPCIMCLC